MSGKRSKPGPGSSMADFLTTYCNILRRGVELIDALSALYQPDAAIDWASRTLTQNANVRMAFADRLIGPEFTETQIYLIICKLVVT